MPLTGVYRQVEALFQLIDFQLILKQGDHGLILLVWNENIGYQLIAAFCAVFISLLWSWKQYTTSYNSQRLLVCINKQVEDRISYHVTNQMLSSHGAHQQIRYERLWQKEMHLKYWNSRVHQNSAYAGRIHKFPLYLH